MIPANRFLAAKAASPLDAQWMDTITSPHACYVAPVGAYDDWYWMYAAVQARGLVITNDDMRDLVSALKPRHYDRWMAQHVVHYSVAPGGHGRPELVLPLPYTTCVQQLGGTGAWAFPTGQDEGWLLARAALGPRG